MTTNDSHPTGASLAVYDRTEALECTGGDADLAAELMEALLAGLPDEIASLEACLSESDWPGLAEYAHQVRSATSYCGVPALNDAISALERAAQIEDPLRCQDALDAVRLQARQLRAHAAGSATGE